MDSQFMFSGLYLRIPTKFIEHIHQLLRECRRYVSDDDGDEETGTELTTQLESTLSVIEEGIQLMEGSPYDNDIHLLSSIRREGIKLIREIVLGTNDCTMLYIHLELYTELELQDALVLFWH